MGFWLFTRYDDVSWLLRAWLPLEIANVAPGGAFVQLREAMYGDAMRRLRTPSKLHRDPPDHTRLRRLVSKAFTPRAIDALRPRITSLAEEMLGAMERRADP